MLSGLKKEATVKLQLLTDAAACVLNRTRSRAHITPVLRSIHGLLVKFKVDFKILLLVFKSLIGLTSDYLLDMIVRYLPNRSLRSFSNYLLVAARLQSKTYGQAAYSHYACGKACWRTHCYIFLRIVYFYSIYLCLKIAFHF